MNLSQEPYVPTVGSLPPHATHAEALAWIERQRRRHIEGTRFSFSIADLKTDRSMGNIGLWIRELDTGRAQVGYAVAPNARGHSIASDALCALATFAWTIPHLHRLEFYIEPWNAASIRTANVQVTNARDYFAVIRRSSESVVTCSSTPQSGRAQSAKRSSNGRWCDTERSQKAATKLSNPQAGRRLISHPV
ncbi:GNAT family N-acetyltransferase [Arthrobacter sp. UYEF21]|uniref:GNAT family N-acetyltransferase n=1 Tax=Arthrobacter sp. UYEF21 TaxID=1756364 RepID=UPI003398A2D1